MRTVRVVAMAAVLALCASAADVRLELHLKRAVREEAIEAEFLARAMPGSKKYMQHLTVEQLAELHRPRAGAAAAVDAFLAATAGASPQGKFVTGDVVKATVATGSAAAAQLGVTGEESDPVVPAELEAHVERILVTRGIPGRKHGGRRMHADTVYTSTTGIPDEFAGMTQNPFTIYARYKVPNATVPASSVQGVCEFNVPMGFSQGAMDLFNEHYGLVKTQVKVSGPNPTSQQAFGASEGQLDVEYISAMAPGATTWWIAAGGSASWPEWCNQVLSLDPLPDVVSISWGMPEFMFQGNLSESFPTFPSATAPIPPTPASVTAAEDAFRKLALAGVTSVAASGDDGPSSWGPNGFFGVPCSTRFGPSYPATSQYVTAVGATYANAATSPEVSVSWSGGGFSEFVKQPSWQKTAVQAYLAAKLPGMPPATMYNASGRAYPDVAALGTNFAVSGNFTTLTTTSFSKVVSQEGWSGVAGTSAASPTFAGIITRIVAERKANKKGTLGCINPTLYNLNKVGQDVTQGKTGNSCFDPTSSVGYGFPVTTGWDAATGLGTPDYTYLLAQLLQA